MTESSSHNNCIAPPEVFNILVCGLAGTGKSTLINTLCDGGICQTQNHKLTQILAEHLQYQQDQRNQPHLRHQHQQHQEHQQQGRPKFVCFPPESVHPDSASTPTMKLELSELDMGDNKRSGRRMHVTFVEASGIGLAENNDSVANDLLAFLERNLANAYDEEIKLSRDTSLPDSRIHLCLYLLSPTGAGVSTIDAMIMKTIAPRVLLLPVLSKADCLSASEMINNKRSILADLTKMSIPVCDFVYGPLTNFDHSNNNNNSNRNRQVDVTVPGQPLQLFAIMASDDVYEKNGRTVRMRRYPWGDREVEDPEVSDLAKLRTVLFESHGFAIRSYTDREIYEKYRLEQMAKLLPKVHTVGSFSSGPPGSFSAKACSTTPQLSLQHSFC